ncbi:hypothetical protein DSO57_1022932 [Entomophthora muscae]|uniref:Uncharacterized protein n=2 Tax=Entomophthora muscae TaxID=34485 RepID=A0ACC2UCS9_9FUNG|nr:hypothetical protein DSO57_1022930 [Entomophthora muscae]KAJ9084599.1 hypothetical protein DSO57_1022932 [Entomophthora muscae]
MNHIETFLSNHGLSPDFQKHFKPEVSPVVLNMPKDECPDNAVTCDGKKYDGCCVPETGKLIFSQFWDKEQPINAFTIHGLWPKRCCKKDLATNNYRNSKIEEDDAKTAVYLDSNFGKQMETYWPTVGRNRWAYQWKKHGIMLSTVKSRCYSNDKEVDEMMRYFKVTLSLYTQYDIMQELSTHGINPGSEYTLSEFHAAIPKWSKGVSLYCKEGELTEIRFSLDGRPNHQFSLRENRPSPEEEADTNNKCKEKFYFPKKAEKKD